MTETSNTVLTDDINLIKDLVTPTTHHLFGPYLKIENIVEKSCISVSQRNSDKEVVSSICLDNCLPIPSVPRGDWLEWVNQIYSDNGFTYSNTMCVHLMVWSNFHQDTFLDHLLSYLYEQYHFLQHIILVLPQQIEQYSFILKYFSPMHKRSEWDQTPFSQLLYVNNRAECIPQTQIKLAKLNDIEDILSLMRTKQVTIKDMYKNRLIEDLKVYDKNRFRLVVTKSDTVIAFIILVGHEVDIHLMQDQFDVLRPNSNLSEPNGKIRSEEKTTWSEMLLEADSCWTLDETDLFDFDSKYCRSPSAFSIDEFMIDNKYEYVIPEILEAAFQIYFTESGYCVVRSDSIQNRSILNFLNPAPMNQDVKKKDLYIVDRVAFLGDISIRDGVPNDFNNMIALIENHSARQTILKELCLYLSCLEIDPSYRVFVIMVDNEVMIGFAMIVTRTDTKFIESHFQIQALCNYSFYQEEDQGLIKYFILAPRFMNRSRLIIKEILRVAEISSLLFHHYGDEYHTEYDPNFENQNATSIIPDIIKTMLPVSPRVIGEYPSYDLFQNIPQDIFLRESPSALYFINKSIACLVHKTCQVRILVSGTSTCGLSFIENLIFDRSSWEPCFTNITFISKQRISPYKELNHGELADNMVPYTYNYTKHYIASLDLRTKVTMRYGLVTEINARDKYVSVDNKYKEHFDYLFIFNEPEPRLFCKRDLVKKVARFRTPSQKEDEQMKITNLFCVGDRVEASRGLTYIEKMVSEKKTIDNILIIGISLYAYACVQNLMSIGTIEMGSKIILVEESDDCKLPPFFNNNELGQAMTEQLNQWGIQTLHKVQLVEYQLSTDRPSPRSHIISVTLEVSDTVVTLASSAIFVFEPICIEETLFNALRSAGVQVQEKILVNKNYQSSVPFIYAAGRSTQYLTKYFLESEMHDSYSLREVGHSVSKMFKTFLNNNQHHEENEDSVRYWQSLVEYCVLPGGYNYLHVYEPGITTNTDEVKHDQSNNEHNTIIKTGEINQVKGNTGYFKIVLDKNRFVKEITCVTQNIISVRNTIELYNKHSSLLNNILERHSVQPIDDLYAYFAQPWTMAIYNDKFKCLLNSIRKLFEKPNEEGETMNDIIERVHYVSDSNDMQEKTIRNAFIKFQTTNNDLTKTYLVDAIMKLTVNFLEENSDYLPMYATPNLIEKLLATSCDISTKYRRLNEINETLNVPRRGFQLPNTQALSNSEILHFMKLGRNNCSHTQKLLVTKMKEIYKDDVKCRDVLSRLKVKKKEKITMDDLMEDMLEDANYF